MGKFIDLILREPVLAIIVLGVIFQTLGRIANAAKAGRSRGGGTAATPGQRSPTRSQRPNRPTAEDIAAEMRRILGMDGAPQRSAPPPVPKPKPLPERVRREVVERPPEPLRTQQLGRLGVRVDPHVGDRLQVRPAPSSGAIGAHELGMLGGRVQARPPRSRGGSRLVDLGNLSRAVVLREILDRPPGLRDLD